MPSFTVRFRPVPSASQRRALEEFSQSAGATISWTQNDAFDRAYALVEAPDERASAQALATAAHGADVFEPPVIALAIRPNVPEALPRLAEALGGPGRPAGVRNVESADGAVVVEWDLDVTPASLVIALVDVELDRVRGSRLTELLSPLPLAWWTRIASEGLQAPEIAPNRVLEALIEDQHVLD